MEIQDTLGKDFSHLLDNFVGEPTKLRRPPTIKEFITAIDNKDRNLIEFEFLGNPDGEDSESDEEPYYEEFVRM